MTKVGLQFHSAPAELPSLITKWIAGEGLWVVAEIFFPDYGASPVASDKVAELEVAQMDRIGLSLIEPDLASKGTAR